MKKGKILIVGLIALLMMGGLILTGCDELLCPNGSCHVYTDSRGDGSYDICGKSSCATYSVPYPVKPNTNVKCNCL